MMSLLRAELRKLARPLVWGSGLAVTGFCLLITWGAANNARGGLASPRIPNVCVSAATAQCRNVIAHAHAAARAAATATSALAQPGEIGHVAAGMLASLPGLMLSALVAGGLRRTDAADGDGVCRQRDVQPGPQPSLDDVPSLIERARECGLRAELIIAGQARPLADATELAGYRVVQEGLTNAIRHASGTAATVRLRYSGDGILIEVADEGLAAGAEGHPVPSDAAGQGGGAGLAGLSERARLLGGQFEAGRCQQGFVVRAFLPSPS